MGRNTPAWDSSYPEFDIGSLPGLSDAEISGLTGQYLKGKHVGIEELIKYYGWGFKKSPDSDARNLERYLAKIIYYMHPSLLPSEADFRKCNSDAGPGLLIPECGALPFSIYHPPPSRDQSTNEYIRKAILQYPYRSLERSPSAFPLLPTVAENRRSQPPGKRRIEYRNGNRGLAGDDGVYGVLNCALVAAHLLDAGCTKADRADPYWHSKLGTKEKNFLDLIAWINWKDPNGKHIFRETLDELDTSMFQRKATLLHEMIGGQKREKGGGNLSIESFWKGCTKSFHQFVVRYEHHPGSINKACSHESQNTTQHSTLRCIPLKTKPSKPWQNTIQEQMAGFFTNDYVTEYPCTACPNKYKARVERRFRELPLRLAFTTAPETPPHSHTASDIVIDYRDAQGEWKRATYRWLGGIYPIKHSGDRYHYNVIWNDHERYEAENGKYRKYDPQDYDGQIRGGFESKNSAERVPLSEWKVGQQALLFYEKVLNPARDFLQEVQDAITRNIESINKSYPVPSAPGNETLRKPGLQTGIRNLQGSPSSAVAPRSTNPQSKPRPKPPPHSSRGGPARSRTLRPQATRAFHHENNTPKIQRDAGKQPDPDPPASGRDPSAHQKRSMPPHPPQVGQISSPSLGSNQHLAGNPVASNIHQCGESPEIVQKNTFDEALAQYSYFSGETNQRSPQNPTGYIQSLDPLIPAISTGSPTQPPSIPPVNVDPLSTAFYEEMSNLPPPLPPLGAEYAQSPTGQAAILGGQDASYFTNYVRFSSDSEQLPEDGFGQSSHDNPTTQAPVANPPTGQPAAELPSSQTPSRWNPLYPLEGQHFAPLHIPPAGELWNDPGLLQNPAPQVEQGRRMQPPDRGSGPPQKRRRR
ncbi:hypothetical protein ACJ72_01199 [Emergomyces africanus]|uniref:Uncharacterized protein n=1 Tax=Emergomyces africanus TaxID=1955775 RepID=A0A1B7P5X4_9EURO|nr:hypothetical protein ACJ72_01199 [Emergomyces africanus]